MRKTSVRSKALAGTLRGDRRVAPPTGGALREWPEPPSGFSKTEAAALARLGDALLPAGTVGPADVELVLLTARMLARADAAFANPEEKITAVTGAARLAADLLRLLGAAPAARGSVERIPDTRTVGQRLLAVAGGLGP